MNSQKRGDSQCLDVIAIDVYNNNALELKKLETQNDFLQPMTLMELAKEFDANSTYLSKFINIDTGNNFSQYINKVRIQYVIERLKTDSKLRSFTIKAFAEEIGF